MILYLNLLLHQSSKPVLNYQIAFSNDNPNIHHTTQSSQPQHNHTIIHINNISTRSTTQQPYTQQQHHHHHLTQHTINISQPRLVGTQHQPKPTSNKQTTKQTTKTQTQHNTPSQRQHTTDLHHHLLSTSKQLNFTQHIPAV